jgi:hypothetical protein
MLRMIFETMIDDQYVLQLFVQSECDRILNRRMRVVAADFKIREFNVENL